MVEFVLSWNFFIMIPKEEDEVYELEFTRIFSILLRWDFRMAD
jgi:hypothetical protein